MELRTTPRYLKQSPNYWLSVPDLARLIAQGAKPGGPAPLPPISDGDAIEVERCVSRIGLISRAGRQLLAAEILAGRPVGIRIEPAAQLGHRHAPQPSRSGSTAGPATPA